MRVQSPLIRFVVAIIFIGLTSCSFLSKNGPVYVQYPVGEGETIESLAKHFGVSVSELKEINQIKDTAKITPGRYIKIPYVEQSLVVTKEEAVTERRVENQFFPAKGSREISLAEVKKYVGKLSMPVKDPRVTSNFGKRGKSFHEGIDLCVPEGTKVYAAHDGEVVFVSEHFSGYGKIVVIRGDSLATTYAHNRRNRVSIGDKVKRGEWIADVGQTGDATGPHLHFETRVQEPSGRYAAVDPRTFLPG